MLNTLAMDEEESRDSEPDEPSQDNFPDGGLFDPDQTLPYMWGDDPDPTLPCMFDEDPLPVDPPETQLLSDTDSSSQILAGDSDSDSDEGVAPVLPLEPRTTRAGQRTQMPARYRD